MKKKKKREKDRQRELIEQRRRNKSCLKCEQDSPKKTFKNYEKMANAKRQLINEDDDVAEIVGNEI